jgi:hypothetical protein
VTIKRFMLAWVVAAAVVVPENSIRAGSRYEAESAHHPDAMLAFLQLLGRFVANLFRPRRLSFPKIISARSDDAIRARLV